LRPLELEGHTVTTATDGLAALKRLGQAEFDAVVLDVLMPDLDGFEVCRRLRASGNRMPDQLDWATIALYDAEARRYGEKVIWSEPASEPAFGWQAVAANSTFSPLAAATGSSLIPMYATNFPSDVPYAAAAASTVVHTYTGMQLGESLQSWYFRDQSLVPTASATAALAQQELGVGGEVVRGRRCASGHADHALERLSARRRYVLGCAAELIGAGFRRARHG
jgi:hypothetical protein